MSFLRYLHRHHVGVLALVLVVVMSGSAYAATRLAKNSVGSPQVRNNSLTGADVRDRSLTGRDVRDATLTGADLRDASVGEADLAATIAETDVVFRRVPEGSSSVLFDDPSLGGILFSCNAGGGLALEAYINGTTATAQGPVNVYASGIDLVDSSPQGVGAVQADQGGTGGSITVFGSGWALPRLEAVLADESQVVHAEVQPQSSAVCALRAVITRDVNGDGTIEAPATRRNAAEPGRPRIVCLEQTGSATCRTS